MGRAKKNQQNGAEGVGKIPMAPITGFTVIPNTKAFFPFCLPNLMQVATGEF